MQAKGIETEEQRLIERIKISIKSSLETEIFRSWHGITKENLIECLIEPKLETYWYDCKERRPFLKKIWNKLNPRFIEPETYRNSIKAYTVLIERPSKLNIGYSIFYYPKTNCFGLGEYDLGSHHEVCHWPNESFCQVLATM